MQEMILMKITRRFAALAVVASLMATVVKAEDEGLKALSGTWVSDGADGINAEWKFDGNKLNATVNGNLYKAEIKVESTAKPHATMDLTITESPENDGTNRVGKAIYKLDGNKLVICVAMPGQNRPEEFATLDEVQYKFELDKK